LFYEYAVYGLFHAETNLDVFRY